MVSSAFTTSKMAATQIPDALAGHKMMHELSSKVASKVPVAYSAANMQAHQNTFVDPQLKEILTAKSAFSSKRMKSTVDPLAHGSTTIATSENASGLIYSTQTMSREP